MNPSEQISGARADGTYGAVAVALHWLIAAALVWQILSGWRMEDMPPAERFAAFQIHKSAGLTILILSLARLGWRLAHPPPPPPETMKAWEKRVSMLVHAAFYVLMIGLPIGGWIIISTSPYSVTTEFWGLFEWPKLPLADLPFRKTLNAVAKSGHSAAAWGVIGLLALHTGAALKHHFIDRDGVLGRMIPMLRRREG